MSEGGDVIADFHICSFPAFSQFSPERSVISIFFMAPGWADPSSLSGCTEYHKNRRLTTVIFSFLPSGGPCRSKESESGCCERCEEGKAAAEGCRGGCVTTHWSVGYLRNGFLERDAEFIHLPGN